jgi:hypothetical protein
MSRYGYDYSLTPGHPKGRRSLVRNVLVVGAIAVIAAVSGGAVVFDLLGSGTAVADRQTVATPQTQPVSLRVAHAVTPAVSAPTSAGAAVENLHAPAAPAQPPAQPSTTPAPQVASTPDAAPTVSAATVEEPKTAQVPERELTFSTGYARRRAVQTAATTTGAGTKTEVARVEEQSQIGRSSRVKPRTTVAHQNVDSRRVADAQAFAFGDPRATRRPSPQQQGGLFSSSPFGGFFRKLF